MITIAFFDDFCLQKHSQFRRCYFEPVKIDESLFFDDNYSISYPSIQWCPEAGKYRMWNNLNHVVCSIGKQDEHMILGMQESDDCIHWKSFKNPAPPCEFPPNCVFAGDEGSIHGAGVWRDEYDSNPKRRYKCALSIDGTSQPQHFSPGVVITSADGIQWDEENMSMQWGHSMSDAYNHIFFNPVLKAYQVIMRSIVTDRRICTTTSKDLITWSKPQVMLSPDPFDPPCCEFYGMSSFYKDGIFYGFLWIFDTDMDDRVPWKFDGSTYTELVYSYDGLHWNRTHKTVQSPAATGEYGATDNYIGNMCESKDQREWFIAGIYPRSNHGSGLYKERLVDVNNDNKKSAFYIGTIKPGRFVGLQSVGNSFLRTKKIYSKDGDFRINAAVPLGQMRVQLVDQWYKPVTGFTFEDSIPFTGDAINHQPEWRTRKLSEVKGFNFAIEVQIFSGVIYGITGDFYPFYASMPQESFGDPVHVADVVFGEGTKNIDYEKVNLKG
ncbi:MAG: hypothetical protein WCI51_05660 [Lentisphaerota bacterium]